MGKFEDNIKNALDQYSVDYNPSHWKKVESQLAPVATGTSKYWKAAIGAILLVGASVAVYYSTLEQETLPSNKTIHSNPAPIEETKVDEVVPASAATPAIEKAVIAAPIMEEQVADEPVEETPSVKKDPSTVAIETIEAPKPVKNNNSGLNFAVLVDKSTVCVKEGIKFRSNVKEPVTYRWYFGDGTESELPSPMHFYKREGKYSVSLELTSVISGESKRVLIEEPIVVNRKPRANFDYEILAANNFSQEVNFSISEYSYKYAEWNIRGEKLSGKVLKLPFNKKGNYPIELVVQNEAGCYDTLVQYISVANDYNLLAPNAFTPDNDGLNDVFLPEALRNGGVRYDLSIFEASTGNLIHSSNQDGNGWDGIDRSTGVKAKQGDYTWSVTLYKTTGEIEKFKGNLKLLVEL